jgi:hypothetical protein
VNLARIDGLTRDQLAMIWWPSMVAPHAQLACFGYVLFDSVNPALGL